MSGDLIARGQSWSSAADLTPRWARGIGIAAAVASAYFLAAQLSLGLLLKPDGVAVFWPAAGISTGVLIALGPHARWPVAAGAMAATFAANLMGDRNIWAASAFALCNAAEALITAGLIQYYFAGSFSLDRLRQVLGLLVAAVVGTVISGIGGAISYKLFHSSTVPMLTTWWHWFASDVVGVVAVAPLVIGLAAAVRRPPPRTELIEGTATLVMLAVTTAIIISLPEEPWKTVVPSSLLFPMLLWLAARCRPVFAAAGAFIVSSTIVWTTIFGVGHFGDANLPIDDRILQAQATILVVTLGAFILAALFSERRESEASLTRSNMLLERERDNKLVNAVAIIAAIAHEVRQPLGAISLNGSAGLRFLSKASPDLEEIRGILNDVISDSHRVSEVLQGIRALFGKVDQGRQPIDVNEIVLAAVHVLRGEMKVQGVEVRSHITSELPLVDGHKSQLQEVIFNLVQNALEAMDSTTNRSRVLRVKTELRGHDAIAVTVEDSGPGIDPEQLDGIFDPFVTTKAHGVGLGLPICRMIVERHGGKLSALSDGKNGALFQFTLPVLPAKITAPAQ
jgi:signal transduction histidine kinase